MEKNQLKEGDVIALCSHNHLDICLPLLSALYIGVKVASLDPTLNYNDCEHLLTMVKDSKYIFSDEDSVKLLEKVIITNNMDAQLVVFGKTDKHIPFSDFLIETGTEEKFKPKSFNIYDPALIFFSSGTTGLPKGIYCSHYALVSQQRYLT